MQKSIETTTTMPPQNPIDSIHETEQQPNQKTQFPESEPELQNTFPISEENNNNNNNSSELMTKKSKPDEESSVTPKSKEEKEDSSSSNGRERLKRHRVEVAGRVWIPDMWGQEGFLKDWIDCGAFDASLVKSSIMSARDSLMEEGRRANSTRFRIQNRC